MNFIDWTIEAVLPIILFLILVVGVPPLIFYAIRTEMCRAKCQKLEMEMWSLEEKECWCFNGKEPVMIWDK